MIKFPLRRNYTTGWYTLKREDAINGLKSHLSERKGVKNISVMSCSPAQLDGDKGYEMQVTYQEDLDETFGFPEDLDRVIFLDADSFQLPYYVGRVALETQAGIVITTPSVKDQYYDVGDLFPQKLANLMEDANKAGIKIVGITPSTSDLKKYEMTSSEMLEHSINMYLCNHPSIEKYIVVNNEDIQELSSNVFVGDDISWGDMERARNILNGKVLTMEKTM